MYLLRRLSTLSCGGKFGESGGEGESGECESPESDGGDIWLPSTYVTQFRGDYWSEKQKEYELFVGLKRDIDGMKAGREIHYRHSQIRHYHHYQATDEDWINPLMEAIQTLATLKESGQGRELMM
ncbi:unnamed protein product [Arabis nemorensis]|uniref:Uncharacterized protein n=1 Tax=Arabis nemorensis TaxID=586526 RepID=A0A565BGH5_9BRAS|nr:unnamed protein product [Arabis nemorensis]